MAYRKFNWYYFFFFFGFGYRRKEVDQDYMFIRVFMNIGLRSKKNEDSQLQWEKDSPGSFQRTYCLKITFFFFFFL